ncbi:MAG: TolC family protein, partial [Desulfosalsimonas sp.]
MKYTPKSTGLHRTRPQGRLCAAAAGAVLLLLLSAVFSGCVRQPKEPSLDLDPPESFSEAGAVEPQDRWWTGFDDKQLNSLVEKALEENFDLRTAWQRLREARALAESRSASLFPEIDAFSEAESRRSPGVRGDEEVFSLGMSAERFAHDQEFNSQIQEWLIALMEEAGKDIGMFGPDIETTEAIR